MDSNFKVYNLSIPGINSEFFKHPFYLNKCEKIDFDGVILEEVFKNGNQTDYISLAPKFKPHSDYEMMLQSTDSIVKSPIVSLTDEAVKHIFSTGYEFIDFISNRDVVTKYELDGGYPYLVFNYDEHTTDRHSGMSKKPFHLHMNSWRAERISNISQINKNSVSPFYYESVVDPVFSLTRTLTRDALDCDELKDFLESANPKCGEQEIEYSAIYRLKKGWHLLQSDEFPYIIKTIHNKLEERYKEVLKCFCGTDVMPDLYTRHSLLPKNVILNNIYHSDMQDTTKYSLEQLIGKVKTITPNEFQEISKNTDYRDTIIPLRWLAYSIGLFSNDYIDKNREFVNNDAYLNCTPRLYTKIGGASIMNFPNYALVKIDRGEGDISELEFNKHVEFQKDFVKKLGRKV